MTQPTCRERLPEELSGRMDDLRGYVAGMQVTDLQELAELPDDVIQTVAGQYLEPVPGAMYPHAFRFAPVIRWFGCSCGEEVRELAPDRWTGSVADGGFTQYLPGIWVTEDGSALDGEHRHTGDDELTRVEVAGEDQEPNAFSESARESLDNYGLSLSIERVAVWQLSWGGPSDEFRISVDDDGDLGDVTYRFLDWFDGAEEKLSTSDAEIVTDAVGEYVRVMIGEGVYS